MAKLPGRKAAGYRKSWRIRVPVGVGQMGMECETNVIEKQGVAPAGMFNLIDDSRRQAIHGLVWRPEARLEAASPAHAAIERQFIQRRPRNVKAHGVKRRAIFADRILVEIE